MRYEVKQHISGLEPIEANTETTTAALYKNNMDENRIQVFIDRGVLVEIPGTDDEGLPEPEAPARVRSGKKSVDPAPTATPPAAVDPAPTADPQLDELKAKATGLGLAFPPDIDAEALAALVAQAEKSQA